MINPQGLHCSVRMTISRYPDLRAIISQCHVLEEVPVAIDRDGDDATKDLQRQCRLTVLLISSQHCSSRSDSFDISECKAALKKVMNLLERHPGSERLREQVTKIRDKWMGK